MNDETRDLLVRLVRERGLAALGTLHGGTPLVSLVLYAAEPDLSALYIHVSGLAQHTRDLQDDPRVGLLIAEPDRPTRNPLTQARVSILGAVEPVEPGSAAFDSARALYLAAHPNTALNFQLGDFHLCRIRPSSARFVAGFGQIVDLNAEAWAALVS